MVHKTDSVKAKREQIQRLEQELKALELEQQRQALQTEVRSKQFWTRHKTLREGLASAKGELGEFGAFVKKEAVPAVRGGIRMGVKAWKADKVPTDADIKKSLQEE